jgi:hypothetical protein
MTPVAVLTLGMPLAMLFTFYEIAAVMILMLAISVILLGLICLTTLRLAQWIGQLKRKGKQDNELRA